MYSLTYKFEELMVCGYETYGTAEIEFDRDREWTIGDIWVDLATHPDGWRITAFEDGDAVGNALLRERKRAITDAVAAYDIPPLAVEREIARYEHERGA